MSGFQKDLFFRNIFRNGYPFGIPEYLQRPALQEIDHILPVLGDIDRELDIHRFTVFLLDYVHHAPHAFHHLAIPRVLIAWAVALIITIILAIIIRRNADSDLYFQIEDITESTYNFLTKAEDEADYEKRSNSNKVYLASMTDFMEEAGDWPDGIFLMGTKSYAYVYNLDKDEIESDSSMMFFTFASPVEENGVMHSRIFICDKETMMQSEEFREI